MRTNIPCPRIQTLNTEKNDHKSSDKHKKNDWWIGWLEEMEMWSDKSTMCVAFSVDEIHHCHLQLFFFFEQQMNEAEEKELMETA